MQLLIYFNISVCIILFNHHSVQCLCICIQLVIPMGNHTPHAGCSFWYCTRFFFMEKIFATLVALIYSPLCAFLVPYKMIPLVKTFITMLALVWFLPRMSYLVFYKITSENETFLTLVALICFLSSVYSPAFNYTSFPS